MLHLAPLPLYWPWSCLSTACFLMTLKENVCNREPISNHNYWHYGEFNSLSWICACQHCTLVLRLNVAGGFRNFIKNIGFFQIFQFSVAFVINESYRSLWIPFLEQVLQNIRRPLQHSMQFSLCIIKFELKFSFQIFNIYLLFYFTKYCFE